MKESLDNETQKILSEGESWKAFVAGEMWQRAKKMILDNVAAVDSISSLEISKPDEIIIEIKGRKHAKEIALEWIAEVEGLAMAHNFNKKIEEREKLNIVEHH